jgi:hypothetical protein
VTGFVPGLEVSRAFYDEVVSELVGDVPHAAALLGFGSDVLGYDTARSTDHGWGPRLQLFVAAEDVEHVLKAVDAGIPDDFRGWPTRYGWDDVAVTHHVEVVALRDWLLARLGFDPREGMELVHWLATPQQLLLEVTRGGVHHDPEGELTAVRDALAWYPQEVWVWLLACQWRRIDQEEPFVGRTAEVGDELGSRIVAARLVRDLVRLAFLLERRYAPYSKWLGSAFRELAAAKTLAPALTDVLGATAYPEREEALVRAVQAAASLHNASGVTDHVDEAVGAFHSRPYRVLGSARFVEACLARVAEPRLRALPSEPGALRAAAGLVRGLALGGVRGSPQPELRCDRLQCSHDVRDVLVQLEPEQLRSGVHLVAMDAGREGRLLQLLLHRLRLEPVQAGRAHETARMDEARELVAREEHPLELCVARHREVLGVGEHGLDQLLRVALLAQDRRAVLGVLVERGVDLVVEVVQERDRPPEVLVLSVKPSVEADGGLDRLRVPEQRLARRVPRQRFPGLRTGRPHGRVR